MEELLPFYERELNSLRDSLKEFAVKHPAAAARLGLSGGNSEDPHVERLVQSSALLFARTSAKVEDDYPEITDAQLDMRQPACRRPFPPCSIVQFDPRDVADSLTEPCVIAKGTRLSTKVGQYRFRSLYDVALAPVCIETAGYVATVDAPNSVSLPAKATGVLSIAVSGLSRRGSEALRKGKLRIHVDGDREVVAAALDGMLLRSVAAYVDCAEGGWRRLDKLPVYAVGFGTADDSISEPGRAASGMALLMDYFGFSERFDFVDVDLAAMTAVAGSCDRLTLRLIIGDVAYDSWPAVRMSQLTADNLKLFCAPVVNLFDCEIDSIERVPDTDGYPLKPRSVSGAEVEVHSINSVRATLAHGETNVNPFHSLLRAGATAATDPYWLSRRPDGLAWTHLGSDMELVLVGRDGKPNQSDSVRVSVKLTCTNRDLPSQLEIGRPGGDLDIEKGDKRFKTVFLSRPTASANLPRTKGAAWHILDHLVPHAIRLKQEALDDYKRLFRHFADLRPMQNAHIDGWSGLESRVCRLWVVRQPCPGFALGIEITLFIDDQAFARHSISTFIAVMDRFFAPYASVKNFVQLIVKSRNTGVLIHQCEPRIGSAPLL